MQIWTYEIVSTSRTPIEDENHHNINSGQEQISSFATLNSLPKSKDIIGTNWHLAQRVWIVWLDIKGEIGCRITVLENIIFLNNYSCLRVNSSVRPCLKQKKRYVESLEAFNFFWSGSFGLDHLLKWRHGSSC